MPRPSEVDFDATGAFGQSEAWTMGLDDWQVRVAVRWDDTGIDALYEAANTHTNGGVSDEPQLVEVLAQHGVHVDDEWRAYVGEQDLVIARIYSDLAEASGREVITTGYQLWEAADAHASDLEQLVAPLIDPSHVGDLWGEEIFDHLLGADMTGTVILLRAVNITPVMRGHGLGAWAAAQSVALFDPGDTLVATLAAPLSIQDAVPAHRDHEDLTAQESTLWQTEQDRLAQHWEAKLGLTPLASNPYVLVWHTSARNDPIQETLASWTL